MMPVTSRCSPGDGFVQVMPRRGVRQWTDSCQCWPCQRGVTVFGKSRAGNDHANSVYTSSE